MHRSFPSYQHRIEVNGRSLACKGDIVPWWQHSLQRAVKTATRVVSGCMKYHAKLTDNLWNKNIIYDCNFPEFPSLSSLEVKTCNKFLIKTKLTVIQILLTASQNISYCLLWNGKQRRGRFGGYCCCCCCCCCQWRTQEFCSGGGEGGVQQIQLRTERTGICGR